MSHFTQTMAAHTVQNDHHIVDVDDGAAAGAVAGAAAGAGGPNLLTKGGPGPSPFEVGLFSYPVQPWTNRNARLSQWFNYGLNPATWSKYSLAQIALYQNYKNRADVENRVHEASRQPQVAHAPAQANTGVFDTDAVLELS